MYKLIFNDNLNVIHNEQAWCHAKPLKGTVASFLTWLLQPVLHGLRHVKRQPFLFQFFANEAWIQVTGFISDDLVQLQSLLYTRSQIHLFNKHTKLCLVNDALWTQRVIHVCDVEP